MTISPITSQQWVSVVKNAAIAGVSAFVFVWVATANPFSKEAAFASGTAAVAAFIKTVEKAFTQG